MTHKPDTGPEGGLDAFFDAARAEVPEPRSAFMARVEADALAAQAAGARRAQAPRGGVLRGLMRALGGWPGVAGLAAAACAGVWLGFAPPEAVLSLWPGDNTLTALDPISGYDFALVEG